MLLQLPPAEEMLRRLPPQFERQQARHTLSIGLLDHKLDPTFNMVLPVSIAATVDWANVVPDCDFVYTSPSRLGGPNGEAAWVVLKSASAAQKEI